MRLAEQFPALRFEQSSTGVLTIVLDGPQLNAVGPEMHRDLAAVWNAIDADSSIRAVLVRGEGPAFSAGGQLELLEAMARDPAIRTRVLHEARAIVVGILDLSKPIVSAIHGEAYGAGLAVGLLADVSIATRTATIVDGHTRLGVAAGDHAVLCWPLLCGMAKAKYHLLTCAPMSGSEAERIGLVSLAVDDEELLPTAERIANELARGAPEALRATKQALNSWYRAQLPAFEASLAHEFHQFSTPPAREGIAALREKRRPVFDVETTAMAPMTAAKEM